MNKTFKILWSDSRRSYVVSSEAGRTKGKPAKIAVAVLSALLASGVYAADPVTGDISDTQTLATSTVGHVNVIKGGNVTVSGSVTGAAFAEDNYGAEGSSWTMTDGALTVSSGAGINVGGVAINGGEITLSAGGDYAANTGAIPKANTNLGAYETFSMTGGTVNLNDARLWIGARNSDDPSSYHDMVFTGGTINMANGGITGMSGTLENDQTVGNTILLNGTDINVKSGDKNVINAIAVEMNDGSITVDSGAKLQVSTYTKEGTEWANPYDSTKGGKFVLNNGIIDVAGTMTFQHMVVNGGEFNVTGMALGDFSHTNHGSESTSLTVNAGKITIGNGEKDAGIEAGAIAINGGEITLNGIGYDNAGAIYKASTNLGGYDGFTMTAGTVNLNEARLWIGSRTGEDPDAYHDMVFSGGTINMANGGITGMSGTLENGQTVGSTILLNGTNINVKSGDKNVINAITVEMNSGSIQVQEGAALQISTYTKDGTEWANPYNQEAAGTVSFNGGTIDASAGQLTIASNKTIIDGATVTVGDLVVCNAPTTVATFALLDSQATSRAVQASSLGNNVEILDGTLNVLGDMTINNGGSVTLTTINSKLIGDGGSFTLEDGSSFTAYTASTGGSIVEGFKTITVDENATVEFSDEMIAGATVNEKGQITKVEINDAKDLVDDASAAALINAIYAAGAHVASDPASVLIVNAMQNGQEKTRAQVVKEASAIANTALVQTTSINAALVGSQAVYDNIDNTSKAWAQLAAMSDDFASADINMGGVVLGGQYAQDNWVAGLSANIGTGSTHTDSLIGAASDFNYYGVNLYGAVDFGAMRFMGQIGYTMGDNDVTVTTGGHSVDTDVINAGVRAQYTAQFGDVSVKPFIGVEYMRVNTDAYGVLASKTEQNIVMVPVGVTMSKVGQTASGWTLAPNWQISYVPAFGDTDAETNVLGATATTTVWGDNMVNTKFGFQAIKGNFGMGVDLGVGVGDQDRLQTAVQARLDYRF